MWLIQLVSTEVAVLAAQNIFFGIPLRDIFKSSADPGHVNFVLYGSILLQLITMYITLYLWTRITLRKSLAFREWLVEMLGEDIVGYLRIPKE